MNPRDGEPAALAEAAAPLSDERGLTAAHSASGRKNYVLVHGAWHGGWCWRYVSDLLRDTGARVFTPTLTGLGERSHLLSAEITLDTHVTDIANVIEWERLEDFILVGHSYGGMVVTGVADVMATNIASIVYLDAFVPQNGQSIIELGPKDGATPGAKSLSIPPAPPSVFGVPAADQAWVEKLCTPQPTATFEQRLALTGACELVKRKTYIRTSSPISQFEDIYQSLRQNPDWRTVAMSCGHDAMIADPTTLAKLLMEA